MTKPLEKMTVDELRVEQAKETDGDFADHLSGLEPFDELARRNKLLVEALEGFLDCPRVLEQVTVPKEGIESAPSSCVHNTRHTPVMRGY